MDREIKKQIRRAVKRAINRANKIHQEVCVCFPGGRFITSPLGPGDRFPPCTLAAIPPGYDLPKAIHMVELAYRMNHGPNSIARMLNGNMRIIDK